jgi:hypothetical protein
MPMLTIVTVIRIYIIHQDARLVVSWQTSQRKSSNQHIQTELAHTFGVVRIIQLAKDPIVDK